VGTAVTRLADTSSSRSYRRVVDPGSGVVTLIGRNRLPSDVVGELMDVLADQPRIVVCDLHGLGLSPQTMVEVFAPVAPYLTNWPGTLVVACVPEPLAHAGMLPAAITHRLLVHARGEDGVEEAHRWLSPLQHTMTYLPPSPAAVSTARTFTIATLRDWRLPLLLGPASLVASELVTDSMLHAHTVVGLSLSRCEDRIRIAVHDHGGGRPVLPTGGLTDESLEGRGLLLVQAMSRNWGVFPAPSAGKTVWAIMDAA
jgi:anti-sigma regulatory factor (Ser/Thr protein kinase)